jgi:hypothetical protein
MRLCALLLLALTACGEDTGPCVTPCGISADKWCDATVRKEDEAIAALAPVYAADVCSALGGYSLTYLSAETIDVPNDERDAVGMTFVQRKEIQIARGMKLTTIAHEFAHVADFELLGLKDRAHSGWPVRGVSAAVDSADSSFR